MKKRVFLVISGLIVIVLIIFILLEFFKLKEIINIADSNEAEIVYVYGDKNITEELSKDDLIIIKDIINGKQLYKDEPSCGFDENISLRFDKNIFSVACDGCPIIKYNNKYFNVSDLQIEEIHNIMKKYGAKFPCV